MRSLASSLLLVTVSVVGLRASTLSLDNTWVVLDQDMATGDFFSGFWTWSSPSMVRFVITDLFVVSDQFNVFDFGSLVVTTPALPAWYDLPAVTDPFQSPPFTDNPDEALASGYFSSAQLLFGPGSHSITIQDIRIPLDGPGGVPFPDGTVAFEAATVPEPSSFLACFALVVACAFHVRRAGATAVRRPVRQQGGSICEK